MNGLAVIDRFVTIELPEKDNKRNVSRIPPGYYPARRLVHPRFGKSFVIDNVTDRDGIMIHPLNFAEQSRGCIGVGQTFKDLNQDGRQDITNSRQTIDNLYDLAVAEKLRVQIVDSYF
nr:hypothetical protein 12 [bacterium]